MAKTQFPRPSFQVGKPLSRAPGSLGDEGKTRAGQAASQTARTPLVVRLVRLAFISFAALELTCCV
jgi:hypothetical protein